MKKLTNVTEETEVQDQDHQRDITDTTDAQVDQILGHRRGIATVSTHRGIIAESGVGQDLPVVACKGEEMSVETTIKEIVIIIINRAVDGMIIVVE